MEKLLKKFIIPAKRSSVEELRLWRNFVMPVKNRRRRFRYVANLDKRLEAKEMMAENRKKRLRYMEALKHFQAGDELGPDMPFGRDGQAE